MRGVTSLAEWKQTLRNAPGPWAELVGKLVILSVPSSAVRDLDDPEALMAYWDEVMEHCYAFYAAPKRNRPERYCVDRQISAGYMHSGYPIMTGDDVAKTFCDLNILRGNTGIKCWGFYHEMGHNFQQPEWTWSAFGEVTNNLFSLYGTETLNGVKVGAHPAMTQAEIDKRLLAHRRQPRQIQILRARSLVSAHNVLAAAAGVRLGAVHQTVRRISRPAAQRTPPDRAGEARPVFNQVLQTDRA